MTKCPCGSQEPYQNCCEIYLKGEKNAPTPESLMRSRYSAFALKNYAYIASTMKDTAAKDFDIEKARKDNKYVQWVQLKVLRSETKGASGTVEFIAEYILKNKLHQLHEISEFKLENGKWYYVDGVIPGQSQEPADNSQTTKLTADSKK